tara:strand:- start:806 stop:1087 length:282 start_codon:yes stop_codon:yes gene_type:complete
MNLEIEIDCAPGITRPNTHLESILLYIKDNDNIEIKNWAIKYIETPPKYSNSFGCWTWNFEIKKVIKDEVLLIFENKLTGLYISGCIRYASWD